jgi:hypothetical protein
MRMDGLSTEKEPATVRVVSVEGRHVIRASAFKMEFLDIQVQQEGGVVRIRLDDKRPELSDWWQELVIRVDGLTKELDQ